ncbi:putative flavonoid 3',5'-hydroxylase [Medicago truncatula]|uniref:Flavonoid hydroxylase n=1 Tax=Medicago truncatula TaxID=3880 RepID=A0A072UUU7_MEDTR|nr:flavonoid 3',5'-hydroxylase 1 [Medicago truncatula]KEH33357.1 flavonoid hydroxylase [Medicago truncatula]RHN66699.1 putative flavonoid 3',5'-hydroxylase [Medicago truncatula]
MAFDAFLLRDIGIAIFIFFISHFFIGLILRNTSKNLPPGPRGWPILGVLPHLGTMPHVTLANMAKKFGPIMYLKMGTCDTVVASSSDAARAFLKTLDHNFLNRPTIIGATYLGYNSQDLVFAKYGPKWKLLRKLTTLHMLGGKALQNWANVRENEVKHMVRSIHESGKKGESIEVGGLLSCAITNMVSQVVLSKRMFASKGQESKEFKEMVVEFMTISGINIGDFVPFIGWIDLEGVVGKMKRLHKRFDEFLTKLIEDHVNCAHERKGNPDFLDIVLANDDDNFGERLSLSNIKALLLNLFTAGTDTSSSIIEWALAEMLKSPNILIRAQKEMNQVVGRERMLVESDLEKLPYLQAICKETYRLHPSTPLSVPRVSNKACQINGYYIPKNTRFNVNIWAIGRDPNIWANPLEFKPERFLSGKYARIDPSGVDFELIPFGAGRRVCVGYKMAIVVIEYILGTLVHSFDWKLPNGVELNMDEAFGLTLEKAVPLSATVTPRLVPHAYV